MDQELSRLFLNYAVTRYACVYGGDINRCYKIETEKGKTFFVKVNEKKRFPGMMAVEAEGVNRLQHAGYIAVPAVISYGDDQNIQYLVEEWIEEGEAKHDFWEKFGCSLAQQHQHCYSKFGYSHDNFIGSLSQKNDFCKTWQEFYAEMRILPLVKILVDRERIQKTLVNQIETFCNNLSSIYPDERPSLLHGDLWSGNFMVGFNGYAVIYDPAVYFGHREMDIAMSYLFGGFSAEFYRSYNSEYPLAEGWEGRLKYSQVYPLLVHAILFGGSYLSSVKNIVGSF